MKLKKIIFKITSSIAFASLILYLKNKANSNKIKKQYPRLGEFIEIQGHNIHYFSEGQGKTLILLHGNNGDIYDFYLSPLWNTLKSKFNVIGIDLPGNGYSKALDWKEYNIKNQTTLIKETIEKLNVKDPIVVGYGLGGDIALRILENNTSNINKTVILNNKNYDKETIKPKFKSKLSKIYLWTLYPYLNKKLNVNKNVKNYEYFSKKELESKSPDYISKVNNNLENESSDKMINNQKLKDKKIYLVNFDNNKKYNYLENKETLDLNDESTFISQSNSNKILELFAKI